MTFKELQDEVIRRLEETSTPTHWTLQEIKDSLNDGYIDMCDASECYEREDQLTVDGSLYYNLEQEYKYQEPFLSMRRVFNIASNKWLEFTTAVEMDTAYYRQWQKMNTGEPIWMLMRGAFNFGMIPSKQFVAGNSSNEVLVRRAAIPLRLEADTDEPVFNREYHIFLADYACDDLLTDDGEVAKGVTFRQSYILGRENLSGKKSSGEGVEGGSRVVVVGG